MRGHFNKNPPDLTIRGILGTIRLLAEVAVQQASESLAVAGLVAGHLMDGVVDGVQVELLGLLGQLELAGLKIGCFPGKSSETGTYFKALRNIFLTSFVQVWYIFLSEKSSHVPF